MIKSGPGYHQEKTYNFGPDGVQTETRTRGGEGERPMKMMGPDMSEGEKNCTQYLQCHKRKSIPNQWWKKKKTTQIFMS